VGPEAGRGEEVGGATAIARRRGDTILTVLTIGLPLAGAAAAALLAWNRGAGWPELLACGVMFVLTLVGVEVGFHRHFAHRSFKAARPLRLLLAGLGSMALQGSVLWWAGVHRVHHGRADREGDPHSPLQGLLHAHLGWLFRNLYPPGWRRASDLFRDEVVRSATRSYFAWGVLGLLLPALAVGLATSSWRGVLLGFLWGGLLRVFLVNHVVWSINSICHAFGSRSYPTADQSRNNLVLALPSLGFSWHNNHHAYPGSAVNAHRWWQLDLCGLLILGLAAAGLAWDVRRADLAASQVAARGRRVTAARGPQGGTPDSPRPSTTSI
jgi:stearoyl-CoA desaturase (delta-9 desaturase)